MGTAYNFRAWSGFVLGLETALWCSGARSFWKKRESRLGEQDWFLV